MLIPMSRYMSLTAKLSIRVAMFALLIMAGIGPAFGGEVPNKVNPVLESVEKIEMHFGGFIGDRLNANLDEWELRAPKSNPALVEMFYDRDRKPYRNLLPWSGEFVGKYLCASILSYRILKDPRQKAMIERVTKAFMASQGEDGYLGPFNKEERLTGRLPDGGPTWDMWGHYWAIRALLMYYQEFNDPAALNAATRAADLIVRTYLNTDIPMTNDGGYGQMNYAIIHAYTELYRITGKPEYLEMANWIVKQWEKPGAGLYISSALAGKEMYQFPGNRWESLHDFLGMEDLYLLTGEPTYREAFTRIWYSILKGDRHNTGGFTSGERTTGNPYDPAAIETCCSVAWIDMSLAMLKLDGDSKIADEIELTTLNGNVGGQCPSGSWWTYNTPMNGVKEASAHTINFQCRPGSPELNCCSVNGPRGLAMLGDWALMKSAKGWVINYYGPSSFNVQTQGGQALSINEVTEYPSDGKVAIHLRLEKPESFEIKLRIPSWSASTKVKVNEVENHEVHSGEYLTLSRSWKDGDTIELNLDMSLHYWAGEREQYGNASIYRGPILLAFDPAYNEIDQDSIPEMDARTLAFHAIETNRGIKPMMLLRVKGTNGKEVNLCDFATAGAYGNYYLTWFKVKNLSIIPFEPSRPVWDNRP